MAIVTGAIGLKELKVYKANNPIKYAHKYGEIDFNDLPEGFEAKLTAYKFAVAKERARRDLNGASQEFPVITPWTFFERPKAVEVEPFKTEIPVDTTPTTVEVTAGAQDSTVQA